MLQNLIKKSRGKPYPWVARNIKTKMIDRDRLSHKMKRKEANICLRKPKSKYYQSLPDENFPSSDKFSRVTKRI